MPEPRASEYNTPPGATRKDPAESLRMLRDHARESGNALLKMKDEKLDTQVLLTTAAEMNGREFVLSVILEEALERIEKLERKVLLLLATASKMIDELGEHAQHLDQLELITQPEEKESK